MIDWFDRQIHFDTDLQAIGAFEELLGRLEGTTFLPLFRPPSFSCSLRIWRCAIAPSNDCWMACAHEGTEILEARWLKIQDDITDTATHVVSDRALAIAEGSRGVQEQEAPPAIGLLQRSVESLQRRVDRLRKLRPRQKNLISDDTINLLHDNVVEMTQAVARLVDRPNPKVQKNVLDAVDDNHFQLGRLIFLRLNA